MDKSSDGFWCRCCGKQKAWNDRDYDVGLFLAEVDSFDALGHTEHVTPYLICSTCADDVRKEMEDKHRGRQSAQE